MYPSSILLSLYHALHSLTPHQETLQLTPVNGRPIITDFVGIGSLDEYINAVENTDDEQLRRELNTPE